MRMLEENPDEGEEVVVVGYESVTRRPQATKRVTPTTFVYNSGDPVGETKHPAKKHLPNGDFYTGFLAGNIPHSAGKYLWPDGCMYEGEWRKGKTAGKGKFSWPSGATFEGEFRASFMDGFGTFTGSNGDTYRGMWSNESETWV